MKETNSYWKRNMVLMIIVGVCLVAAAIAYPFLPAKLPLQWNMSGQVSRTGEKWHIFLIALLPGLIYWSLRAKYWRK